MQDSLPIAVFGSPGVEESVGPSDLEVLLIEQAIRTSARRNGTNRRTPSTTPSFKRRDLR